MIRKQDMRTKIEINWSIFQELQSINEPNSNPKTVYFLLEVEQQ